MGPAGLPLQRSGRAATLGGTILWGCGIHSMGEVSVIVMTCELLFCPRGSAAPRNVSEGYYSVGGNRTTRHGQAKCDGLENRRQTHRIGLDRAPYCSTSTLPRGMLHVSAGWRV